MTEFCHSCKQGPCKLTERKCDGLEEELGALQSSTADWYPGSVTNEDGTVSIEQAASSEHKLKKFFDDQVAEENLGRTGVKVKGVPPCVRAKTE